MAEINEQFKLKMEKLLGTEAPDFFKSLEEPCKKAITVNFSKISKEDFEKIADFDFHPIPQVNNGYIVDNLKVGSHILNHLGVIYSQEPSAMYPVEMLDIILSTTMFELGYIWTWGNIYSSVCQFTTNEDTNIASKFKAMERVCNKGIQSTLEAVEKVG